MYIVLRGDFPRFASSNTTKATDAFLQQQNTPTTPSSPCLHQPNACEAWPALLCEAVGKV
jgi:hypothetical protein